MPIHGTDLVRVVIPRAVDVVRALLGEIEALTATGDPPAKIPTSSWWSSSARTESRRAELRPRSRAIEPARLMLQAANGSLTLEIDRGLEGPSRLIRQTPTQPTQDNEISTLGRSRGHLRRLASSVGRPAA